MLAGVNSTKLLLATCEFRENFCHQRLFMHKVNFSRDGGSAAKILPELAQVSLFAG